jgi:hypothetical protein
MTLPLIPPPGGDGPEGGRIVDEPLSEIPKSRNPKSGDIRNPGT